MSETVTIYSELSVPKVTLMLQLLEFHGNCVAAAGGDHVVHYLDARACALQARKVQSPDSSPLPTVHRPHRPLITTNNFSSIIDDVRAS